MNNAGSLETDWADGTYSFRLSFNGVIELEQKCNAPFAEIVERVNAGKWAVSDVRETIRLALIGGKMEPVAALNLVRGYVDDMANGLAANAALANVILLGAMYGFQASPLVAAAPKVEGSEESQSASTPPKSSRKRAGLASVLETLTPYPSGNGPLS